MNHGLLVLGMFYAFVLLLLLAVCVQEFVYQTKRRHRRHR